MSSTSKVVNQCYMYEQKRKKQRGARIKIQLKSSPKITFLRKYLFPRRVTNNAYRNNVTQRATLLNCRKELENSMKEK